MLKMYDPQYKADEREPNAQRIAFGITMEISSSQVSHKQGEAQATENLLTAFASLRIFFAFGYFTGYSHTAKFSGHI